MERDGTMLYKGRWKKEETEGGEMKGGGNGRIGRGGRRRYSRGKRRWNRRDGRRER
jgi:hypothetical protein